MKWNQFRLKTTTEAEDIVSSMLADLGIEGVQIEDKIPLTQSDKEQMFVDILPDMPEDDGCAYLTFYLDEEVDKHEMLLKVRQELEEMRSYLNVGDCTIEESQTEDVDWVNNWKQYFHQFYIDDILVIPSWENVEAKDSDKMVIHIDPPISYKRLPMSILSGAFHRLYVQVPLLIQVDSTKSGLVFPSHSDYSVQTIVR